jgi:two-component system sensor histidine kinase QseC
LGLEFDLDGRRFMGINGGPHASFNDAVSFSVSCETQEEVDRYWSALTADGGEEVQCGWLKDRFGVSWQIVPTALPRLLGDPDREKAGRAAAAMMKMVKLDIAALEAAARG